MKSGFLKWGFFFVIMGGLALGKTAFSESVRFYCGTYTQPKTEEGSQSVGIGIFDLDLEDGSVERIGDSPAITNPSHFCLSSDERFLYSVSEIANFEGLGEGSITVFRINSVDGGLDQVQAVRSYGKGPAYVSLDRSEKFLFVANYSGGTAAVLPIDAEGRLGEAVSVVRHEGKSAHPNRQEAPHPHSIVASPDNRFVYVPDLGIDRIVVYAFDETTGRLSPRPDLDVATPPGSGPRHLTFDPQGRFACVSLELTSELADYRYEPESGRLTENGRHSTLPDDFDGENTTAEVRISPRGNTVCISNRGHDSIAIFHRKLEGAPLENLAIVSTGGKTPRNFGIDPTGRYLIAANQNSHSLATFRIDEMTGGYVTTAMTARIPFPVFIGFSNPH